MRIAVVCALLAALSCGPRRPEGPPPFYADKSDLMHVLDGEGGRRPVRTRADWEVRRDHIRRNFMLVAGEAPPGRDLPLDVQVLEEKPLEKYARRAISFQTVDGDRVPALLLVPVELKGRAPAALCLHQTSALGKREPAGEGNRNLAYAAELAARGWVALAPDYPNFGDSKVDVYAQGYASATMKGIRNHRRAVDVLLSMPEVDGGRVAAIGHSLGGHNAIFAAVFDERIGTVVTSCGFNAFPKYYGGNLAGWGHKGYMPRIASAYGKDPAKMPFDFTELLGVLAPRRVFINAPLRDANFEVSGVRDCVEAARPVYALYGAADSLLAVHPDAAHDFPPDIREQAYKFMIK